MPKISVIAASYNHEKYARQAIGSVLNQTLSDFELIVTDDASTDRTVEEIKSFDDSRLLVLENTKRAGLVLTSERSWHQSSGVYITRSDTDDVLEPNMLKILSRQLDDHPNLIAVFAQASYIDDDGNPIPETTPEVGVGLDRCQLLNRVFRFINPFCTPTGMVRRSAYEQISFFPPHLGNAADYAAWINLLFLGDVIVLPDVVLRYRIRANRQNLSALRPDVAKRLAFEHYKCLQIYRQKIKTIDLLGKIFPEISEHKWPLEDQLVDFHLAQLALKFGEPPHRLFGLDILYDLMSVRQTANLIREKCEFDYLDLYRLAGRSYTLPDDGFNERYQKFEEMQGYLKIAKERIKRTRIGKLIRKVRHHL